MKILICVPVYNRKKLTKLVLSNLYKYKDDATLWVFNDWSTKYDNDFLEPYADKVFKLEKSDKIVVKNEKNKNGMGVQHLRWFQFREFLKHDFDAIYMTDNDALHDPEYIKHLKYLSNKYSLKNGQRLPISLYNTKWHSSTKNLLKETSDVCMRYTAAGISQLFTREMVEKIVSNLDKEKTDPDYGWDYKVSEYLKLPFICSKTSYVEHFGADSDAMHGESGNYERDRAISPTDYLKNIRLEVIDYLEKGMPCPKI